MPHVGEDKFFWASNYPHPDHPGRGILGENVARAYRLS
jgi:hypothetical protein